MPGQRIDSYKRGQIVALHRFAHWSQHQIAHTLQISRTTVRRIVHQSEHGEPRTPPRPKGRPPVCTTRKRSRLIDRLRLSTENRRLPLDQLARLKHLHYDIRTLRKALEKEGYSRRIARSKPLLTEKQKERRLQWARDHLNWSDRQWGRVIWTDEASIRCGLFGQVYVTRAIGEEFEPDCLVARFRKYSACMIWELLPLMARSRSLYLRREGLMGLNIEIRSYHGYLRSRGIMKIGLSLTRSLLSCRTIPLFIRPSRQWPFL